MQICKTNFASRYWGCGAKAARSSPTKLHPMHRPSPIIQLLMPPLLILQEGAGSLNGGALDGVEVLSASTQVEVLGNIERSHQRPHKFLEASFG
jgi:hypothetical protein